MSMMQVMEERKEGGGNGYGFPAITIRFRQFLPFAGKSVRKWAPTLPSISMLKLFVQCFRCGKPPCLPVLLISLPGELDEDRIAIAL